MIKMHLYVAAPYPDIAMVRQLHMKLETIDIVPTSSWASGADNEDFSKFTPMQLRRAAEANDQDIHRAHAVLVIARPGAGGEMFAEARYAEMLGMPIFWVGRLTLSSWRPNVVRCASIEEALVHLEKAAHSSVPFAELNVGYLNLYLADQGLLTNRDLE